MAKFEVCCHKFADLSESNYGVSILNDSKYGFATVGNLMRLSLLRAPKAPDAHADMGRHHIRYAIFPHTGPLDHRTVRAGYSINNPVKIKHHANPTAVEGLLSSFKVTGDKSIVLDTVKRGENDEDVWYDGTYAGIPKQKGKSIILRLFDSLGGKSRATLTWGDIPVKKVRKVNVLEDEVESEESEMAIEESGKGVKIELRAFEVATYKLFL
jgi:alpha-mannosidase